MHRGVYEFNPIAYFTKPTASVVNIYHILKLLIYIDHDYINPQ